MKRQRRQWRFHPTVPRNALSPAMNRRHRCRHHRRCYHGHRRRPHRYDIIVDVVVIIIIFIVIVVVFIFIDASVTIPFQAALAFVLCRLP